MPLIIYVTDHAGPSMVVQLQDATWFQELANKEGESGIKVMLGEKDISDATIYYFLISNAGSTVIKREDFDGDLTIGLKGSKYVINPESYDSYPKNIAPKLKVVEGGVAIEPLLLNPGDRVGIKVIAAGEDIQPSAQGRIAGIENVKYEGFQRYRGDKRLAWVRVVAVPVVSFCMGFLILKIDRRFKPSVRYAFLLLAMGAALTITRAVPYGLFDWTTTRIGYNSLVIVPFILGTIFGVYSRYEERRAQRAASIHY